MKINKRQQLIIIMATIILFAIMCSYGYTLYYDRKVPNFTKTIQLYIYPNITKQEVLNTIINSGGVKSRASLNRIFKNVKLHPGHYVITPSAPSIYVLRMLNNQWQSPINLVIDGLMRSKQEIARKISSQLMLKYDSVLTCLNNDAYLKKFGTTSNNVPGLFIRDTYNIYWTDNMDKVLSMQLKAYKKFWTQQRLAKADTLGLTIEQVLVLASIVNGETRYVPEMANIAGVYMNRLRIGMKLQADPTVAYCFDYKLNRIKAENLKVDSPYNTYKYLGLPPGPICVPTQSAIDAVLNYNNHKYIYFCANPSLNGTHIFAKDFRQHVGNAKAFRKALNNRV